MIEIIKAAKLARKAFCTHQSLSYVWRIRKQSEPDWRKIHIGFLSDEIYLAIGSSPKLSLREPLSQVFWKVHAEWAWQRMVYAPNICCSWICLGKWDVTQCGPQSDTCVKEGKHNGAHSHTSAQRLWQDALQAWWTHKSEYTEAWGKVIGIFGAINQVRKDLHFGCKTCSPGLEGEKTLK